MKKTVFTLLVSPLLSVMVCAEGTGNQEPGAHPDPAQITQQLVIPAAKYAVNAATEAVFDAMQSANAAEWALWDILAGFDAEIEAGAKKPAPDKTLVETWLRLRMRCNTGDLVWKGVYAGKARFYPEDKDFEKGALEAQKGASAALVSLKPGKNRPAKERKTRLEKLLETARKKMVFRLTYAPKDYTPKPPAPTPAEKSYLEKAESSKTEGKYSFPPW